MIDSSSDQSGKPTNTTTLKLNLRWCCWLYADPDPHAITYASWMQNCMQFAPAIVYMLLWPILCIDVKINACDRFLSGCMVTFQ